MFEARPHRAQCFLPFTNGFFVIVRSTRYCSWCDIRAGHGLEYRSVFPHSDSTNDDDPNQQTTICWIQYGVRYVTQSAHQNHLSYFSEHVKPQWPRAPIVMKLYHFVAWKWMTECDDSLQQLPFCVAIPKINLFIIWHEIANDTDEKDSLPTVVSHFRRCGISWDGRRVVLLFRLKLKWTALLVPVFCSALVR